MNRSETIHYRVSLRHTDRLAAHADKTAAFCMPYNHHVLGLLDIYDTFCYQSVSACSGVTYLEIELTSAALIAFKSPLTIAFSDEDTVTAHHWKALEPFNGEATLRRRIKSRSLNSCRERERKREFIRHLRGVFFFFLRTKTYFGNSTLEID